MLNMNKINLKIKTMSLKYEAPHSSLTSLESKDKMQLFHAPQLQT
jgi:hypothetical protein